MPNLCIKCFFLLVFYFSIKIERLGNALQDLTISEMFSIKNEHDLIDSESVTTVKPQQQTQILFTEERNKTTDTNETSLKEVDQIKEFDEDSTQQLSLNINNEDSFVSSISFKVLAHRYSKKVN